MEDLDNLKDQLLELVDMLEEEEGMDLSEDHPLFRWSYPERPHIEFQLLIKEIEETTMPPNTTVH
jgi:hypothetical protein